MSGLTHLPGDVLLRVVPFLSPLDIIRLRQVSKTLYSVTCQHALVQSTKLEPRSTRNFHLDAVCTSPNVGNNVGLWHFLHSGSWLITITGPSVVYRNLNSDDPQNHVLFRLDSGGMLIRFQCADTVTLAGYPITYVLIGSWTSADKMTLLKIVGHFGSSLSVEAAIPLPCPRPEQVQYMTASPGYICMYGSDVSEDGDLGLTLLDVTTEKMYRLPAFKSSVAPEIRGRSARSTMHLHLHPNN